MKILIINNAAFHEGEDGKPRVHNKNGDLGLGLIPRYNSKINIY